MLDNPSSNLPTPEWRTSRPPPELLHIPPGTSYEIEAILEPSIWYLQTCLAHEDRREREEKHRLGRRQRAKEENSLQRRQEQQEQHLLVVLEERSGRQPTSTGNIMQQRQQLAAETTGLSVEALSRHRRNVSAPANISKGKEISIRGFQGNLPQMDSQQTPSSHGVGIPRSGRSSVTASPPQAQRQISISTPEEPAGPARGPSAAIASPPAFEGVSIRVLEEPPSSQGSRSVSSESPPAYENASSSTSPVSSLADTKGSSTPVKCPSADRCPSADMGGSSSRKWGLRKLRPYLTAVFKPGSRSNRGISSRRTSGPTSKTVECVSCMEDFDAKETVHLPCHDYCGPCFFLLIETSISTETSWPPKCCLNKVPNQVILSNVRGKLKARYETMLKERSIPLEDRVYCSKSSCGSWIPLHKIDKYLFLARCARCRHKTCIVCRGSYHSNGECPEDPHLRETLRCAINAGWRRCYKCNALVEHSEGCSHMTCRCRAQFCYTCGLKWKTCGCTEIELEEHLVASQWRSENAASQTHMRQAAHAALGREVAADQTDFADELREILNLLENAEEGIPEDRAVDERALAVAILREAEEGRVRDFEDKLRKLREEMDFVHSIQQIANLDRFEEENKLLADRARGGVAYIDKVLLGVLPQEEKARERDRYVAFLKENYPEPSEEVINGMLDPAAWTRTWKHKTGSGSDPHTSPMSPGERKKTDQVVGCVEYYRRFCTSHTDLKVDHALAGATTAEAKARQLAQEKRQAQQKVVVDEELESQQEELRAAHQSDKKWFEEIAKTRDEMLVQRTLDEFSI